jgi:hypothetical protein
MQRPAHKQAHCSHATHGVTRQPCLYASSLAASKYGSEAASRHLLCLQGLYPQANTYVVVMLCHVLCVCRVCANNSNEPAIQNYAILCKAYAQHPTTTHQQGGHPRVGCAGQVLCSSHHPHVQRASTTCQLRSLHSRGPRKATSLVTAAGAQTSLCARSTSIARHMLIDAAHPSDARISRTSSHCILETEQGANGLAAHATSATCDVKVSRNCGMYYTCSRSHAAAAVVPRQCCFQHMTTHAGALRGAHTARAVVHHQAPHGTNRVHRT